MWRSSKIDLREELPIASLGDSDQLKVGDWVRALGSPLGLEFTVTVGIVSARDRQLGTIRPDGGVQAPLEAFTQTDAAINPGNSGGPLVNLLGEMVGVNTAIVSPSGLFAGAGFSVPINLAMRVARDLIEFGVVRRPQLGVQIQDVTEADAEVYGLQQVCGAEVVAVTPSSAAARAGTPARRCDRRGRGPSRRRRRGAPDHGRAVRARPGDRPYVYPPGQAPTGPRGAR